MNLKHVAQKINLKLRLSYTKKITLGLKILFQYVIIMHVEIREKSEDYMKEKDITKTKKSLSSFLCYLLSSLSCL